MAPDRRSIASSSRRLEARGLSPSPQADKRTLIRRATFDLLGLPPTPEEVGDCSRPTPLPVQFDRLIDRLLASPRYGERWGRYWLDVARYADTKGYILFQDANYHWAYTYRDYVIGAFNQDLPYDRFLIEQIAADRLQPASGKKPLTALGFLTLGGRFMGNVHDVIDDRIDVVCRGLMSLTVTCARCHDHKFDPIPAQDYYSLYGVLASAREPDIPPEAAEPRAHGGLCAVRQGARVSAAKAERVRRRQASRNGRGVEAPSGRVPAGWPEGTRPAEHRRLHAARRWNRPEPHDAGPVASLPGTDAQNARRGLCPVACACELAGSRFPEGAARLIAKLSARESSLLPATVRTAPVNPIVLQALAARPLRSLAEAARFMGSC